MYLYEAIITEKISEDSNTYSTYGISLSKLSPAGKWIIIRWVEDITTNHQSILTLVDKCNKYLLSPIHLDDIIYDFLLSC